MAITFYYEFPDHEYYALIKVTDEAPYGYYHDGHIDAAKIYADVVAGENHHEVLHEAFPVLITASDAFEKYVRAITKQNENIAEAIKDFDNAENVVLLIDAAFC